MAEDGLRSRGLTCRAVDTRRSMDTTHTCPRCHVTQALEAFYSDRSKTSGHSSWCRTCLAARIRTRDRAKANAHDRAHRLRKRYGLSLAAFDAMTTLQDHRCAICREPLRRTGPYPGLIRGQGHARGTLRGLVCQRCHAGIECFHGNPSHLESAWRFVLGVGDDTSVGSHDLPSAPVTSR